MDLISIIVPIYNVEAYLPNCLNSLINQTYPNLEIILVDDGSTDKCPLICDEYQRKYDNIICYHKPNGGLSDARNFGLSKACGKYICFVDSDDYVCNKFIEALYLCVKNYQVKLAAVGFKRVYGFEEQCTQVTIGKNTELYDTTQAISYLFSENKFCNYAWNKIYLRELFEDVTYPIGKKMEDLATTYKLVEKCQKIAYDNAQLYCYFQREDSILQSKDTTFFEDFFEMSYLRFINLKKKYPQIIVNDIFMINVLLTVYPHLIISHNTEEMITTILKKTKGFALHELRSKAKIKYAIFCKSKKIYKKLFVRK